MDQLAKESCCSFSFVRCCLVLRLGVDEEFVDCRVLQVLGDGPAGDGDAVAVEQAGVEQHLQHDRHAADAVGATRMDRPQARSLQEEIARVTRASVLETLGEDYIRTARAKGLGEYVVVMVHVLRNSMIPVVTVIALGIPSIFGGAIITEQVFKVNGLGQLLISAINNNDLPMVQTLTFIFAVLIVFFNLIADILYGVLDPRIRYD